MTDRKKICRARKRSRSKHVEAATTEIASKKHIGLYFHGKRDETLSCVMKGNRMVKQRQIEDHYTLILEPDTRYKAYVTPQSGCAKDIAAAICDEMGSMMDDIRCNTNTGSKGVVGSPRILNIRT